MVSIYSLVYSSIGIEYIFFYLCWIGLGQMQLSLYNLFLTIVSHHLMVLPQVDQLFLQRLDVALQVHANNVGVVQNLSESGHISLHRLTHGHLILHPNETHCVSDMFPLDGEPI